MAMKKQDFYYDLPERLIAQTPPERRDLSKLMILHRHSGEVEHKIFYELPDLLEPGDCLILNDSRVLPARLYGVKDGTNSIVEFLLLTQKGTDTWEVLTGPGKKAKIGSRFTFGDGTLKAEIIDIVKDGNRIAKFEFEGNFFSILEKIGEMPLPHYIKQKLQNKDSYQTVYAKEPGSVAAPTAGLHFTREILDKLQNKGVKIGFVTLHVGLGTFRPVKADDITQHEMHSEHYSLPESTAKLIEETKRQNKRIIAVGTTSCRTLEAIATEHGKIIPCDGWTDIFIYPGYQFKVIDGMITNFHLPESTLIMLVSAFAGLDNVMRAYNIAIENEYRFYSFGDAMLII